MVATCVVEEEGRRGVGPSRGKGTSNFQERPATQRHGSRQPLEQTSRRQSWARGIDQIPTSKGGRHVPTGEGGMADVMRDIFAHLMQMDEEVCRTMQKRRDTGKKRQKTC